MEKRDRLSGDISIAQFAQFILYLSEEDLHLSSDLFEEAKNCVNNIQDLFAAFMYLEILHLHNCGLLKYMYTDTHSILSDSICGVVDWQKSFSRGTFDSDMLYITKQRLSLHHELHYIIAVAYMLSLKMCNSTHAEFVRRVKSKLKKREIIVEGKLFGFDLTLEALKFDTANVNRYNTIIDKYLGSAYYLDYRDILVVSKLIINSCCYYQGKDAYLSIDNAIWYILQQYVISGIRKELRCRFGTNYKKHGYSWHLPDSERTIYDPALDTENYSGKRASAQVDGILRFTCGTGSVEQRWIIEVKTNKFKRGNFNTTTYPFDTSNRRELTDYIAAYKTAHPSEDYPKGVLFHITFNTDEAGLEKVIPLMQEGNKLIEYDGKEYFGYYINFNSDDNVFEVSKEKFAEFCDLLGVPVLTKH